MQEVACDLARFRFKFPPKNTVVWAKKSNFQSLWSQKKHPAIATPWRGEGASPSTVASEEEDGYHCLSSDPSNWQLLDSGPHDLQRLKAWAVWRSGDFVGDEGLGPGGEITELWCAWPTVRS